MYSSRIWVGSRSQVITFNRLADFRINPIWLCFFSCWPFKCQKHHTKWWALANQNNWKGCHPGSRIAIRRPNGLVSGSWTAETILFLHFLERCVFNCMIEVLIYHYWGPRWYKTTPGLRGLHVNHVKSFQKGLEFTVSYGVGVSVPGPMLPHSNWSCWPFPA